MPRIKVPSLKSLQLFADNPSLGDPTIPGSPIPLSISHEYAEDIFEKDAKVGGVRLSLGLQTHLLVVNDPNDLNSDGFFDFGEVEQPAAEDPEAAPELEPLVQFDAAKAYVVVTGVSVSGKLAGSHASNALRLGLDGSANLQVATCTALNRTTLLCDGTNEAFDHFKTIFSLDDLRQLRRNETLLLAYGGSLKVQMEISAACLGDALATGLQAALSRTVPLSLAVLPRASIAVNVEVTDGYRLYVQRCDGDADYLFSVRKAASRVLGVEGSVGLKVEFVDAIELLDALTASVSKITGLPGHLVDRACTELDEDELTPDERELVDKAVDVLKLKAPSLSAWRSLKRMLATAEEHARRVVPQKLTAAFGYTWRRMTLKSHVARFRMTFAALERHHADILRLNLTRLMTEARSSNGAVVFEKFLGKKMTKVEIGRGFCFALNEFTFLKSWDTRSTRYIWLRDLDSRVQVSFLGKRGYESTWLGRSEGHLVEIDASMPRFIAAPPRPRDFEVGFHVAFTWKKRKLGALASEVADHALMVGAVPSATVEETLQVFSEGAELGQAEGDATVSILVPPSVSELVLQQISGADGDRLLAHAMARALPSGKLGESFPERAEVDRRMRRYAPVWGGFLQNRTTSLDTLGITASKQFELTNPLLARHEEDRERNWGWSVRGIARNFGGAATLLDACDDFRFAFRKLAQRGDAGATYQVFEDSLRAASPLWADHFGARVFASLLYLAAGQQAGLLKRVGRKVAFTWKEGEMQRALEVKQGDELI